MELSFLFTGLIFGYFVVQLDAVDNYVVMDNKESWKDVWSACRNISGSLVPDLGTSEIANQLLPLIPTNEMIWLFAKEITMEFKVRKGSLFRYAHISYRPAVSYLDNFLCSSGEPPPAAKYVWESVRQFCERVQGSLLKVASIRQLRYIMPLLKDDMDFWIDKYDAYTLPAAESTGDSELCIGIVKESETTFSYRAANCATELGYICDITKDNMNKYAPTVKRKAGKLPLLIIENRNETYNGTADHIYGDGSDVGESETTPIGPIIGPIAGVIVLALLVAAAVIYVKKKKRQQKYQKRRQRYFSRRSKRGCGSIQNEDIQHIDRDGTLDSLESNKNSVMVVHNLRCHLMRLSLQCNVNRRLKSSSGSHMKGSKQCIYRDPFTSFRYDCVDIMGRNSSVMTVPHMLNGFHGMDKGRYVHLREDATISTMVSQGQGQDEGQYECQVDKKSTNIDQPGYYLMEMKGASRPSYINKKAAIQVPTCYESFDPDPVQLKEQIKSIKSKKVGNKVQVKLPSDLKKSTEIKKTPLKPVKQVKDKEKDDSHQYKQPPSVKPPELPVKKFKGAKYLGNRQGNKAKEGVPVNANPLPVQQEMYASKNLGIADLDVKGTTKQDSKLQPTSDTKPITCIDDLTEYEPCNHYPVSMSTNGNKSSPKLDDLDSYENFNSPSPRDDKGNNQSANPTTNQGLNELGQYEDFDEHLVNTSKIGATVTQGHGSHIKQLNDLDQYENFETKDKKVNDDILWKDIDNYENLPLNQ